MKKISSLYGNISFGTSSFTHLKSLIPLKLFASSFLMLLCDKFTTLSTVFRANKPLEWNGREKQRKIINFFHHRHHHHQSHLDNSFNLLCEALKKVNFVRSAMCGESNLTISLKLKSKDSASRSPRN